MHSLLFTLICAISLAQDVPVLVPCGDATPCAADTGDCIMGFCVVLPPCDAACEAEETCIGGRCIEIRQPPVCEPACADTEICNHEKECISTVCDPPCAADTEQCMVGFCVDMATVFPQVGATTDVVCAAFDNCKDYISGCDDCEYNPETGVTTCEALELDADACDPLNPPTSQCIECVEDFELSDIEGDTCCVAVISGDVRLAAIEASMMGLGTPIDADGDGYISRDEFNAFISLLPDNNLPVDADTLFHMIDTDGDDMLSEGERQAAFLELYAEVTGLDELEPDVPDVVGPDVITPAVIESASGEGEGEGEAIEGDVVLSGSDEVIEGAEAVDDGGDAGAMANGGNSVPDMFGIEDATPAETYSILTVIIIASVVILVVLTWGIYQYAQKRNALKELHQIEDNQDQQMEEEEDNNECDPDIDEKPLYETEVVTQTRD